MNTKRFNFMAGFLSAIATIGFLAVFGVIATCDIPKDNRDFFNTALIALISFVSMAFGYYLGSSLSSSRKSEFAMTPPPAETPAPVPGERH